MQAVLSEDQIYESLRGVMDPEINHNIVELGMVRGVEVDGGTVYVGIVPTSTHCPFGAQIVARIRERLGQVEGVTRVEVAWGEDSL